MCISVFLLCTLYFALSLLPPYTKPRLTQHNYRVWSYKSLNPCLCSTISPFCTLYPALSWPMSAVAICQPLPWFPVWLQMYVLSVVELGFTTNTRMLPELSTNIICVNSDYILYCCNWKMNCDLYGSRKLILIPFCWITFIWLLS